MKIIKNPVFMFILGVVTCTITTVLASSLIASNISYTPQDKTWGVTNVGAALDSLMLSKTSDNYSTDEKVVGTWIDGKPLYQKTFIGSINGNKTIILTDSNIIPHNIFGVADNAYPMNVYDEGDYCLYTRYEDNSIQLILRKWVFSSYEITVQYTKITD